ncbi:MAG: hypothetical protein L0Y72_27085 [Gemmataceae bacterium]|nr:hypothetical protein [Gemmataceae bacterium]MCI0742716.1 hypothetical protein [Gemmataceae bacterium]
MEDRVTPSVYWDNEGMDGLWETALNWSDDQIPDLLDAPFIDPGFSITANANVAVGSITSNSPITFNADVALGAGYSSLTDAAVVFNGEVDLAGTLALDVMSWSAVFNGNVHLAAGASLELYGATFLNGITVDGDGVLAAGMGADVRINGTVAIANFVMMSEPLVTIPLGSALNITDTMDFYDGEVVGPGMLRNQATLNILGDPLVYPNKLFTGLTVENPGTANWLDGDIGSTDATFNNTGTFNIEEDAEDWNAEGGSFENTGTVNSAGIQDPMGVGHQLAVEFNSANLVNVTSGILTLAAGGHLAGAVTIAGASSTVLGGGAFFLNPGLVVQGQGFMVQGTDATVTGTVTAANYLLRAGSLGGAGTFIITTEMDWIGGSMSGSGITRINAGAVMLVDVELSPTETTSVTQTERTLENLGTVHFGSTDDLTTRWILDGGATIDNRGRFNMNPPPGRTTDLISGPELGSVGVLLNSGQLAVNANMAAAAIFLPVVRNLGSGAILTNAGSLGLSVDDFENYGYFETQQGAMVGFGGGRYTFNPEAEDTSSEMMRGQGWHIAGSANLENLSRIIVPQVAAVQANNFELAAGGVLQGLGTFSANYFRWTGGSMERGDEEPAGGIGTTGVYAGQRMVIDGSVSLSGREILNHGSIEWQTNSPEIAVSSLGTINNDGGTFHLYSQFGSITAAPDAGKLIVRNGGFIIVHEFFEPDYGPQIWLFTENQNAYLVADGNVQFFGEYLQSGANAKTVLGSGTYTFTSSSRSLGGNFRLNGGVVDRFSSPLASHSENTTFELRGFLTQSFGIRHSRLDLIGDLNCGDNTSRVEGLGSETHLHGFTLTTGELYNWNTETRRGVVYRENGTIRATVRGNGDFRGAGMIDGDYEMISGSTDQIGDGASFGTLTVTGDFSQEAGVTFTFGIGAANQDRLIVGGQASVNGTLAVVLESGFLPDPQVPDTFDIITAASINGAFENTTIDLPGDLYFDIVIDGDTVALVTKTA